MLHSSQRQRGGGAGASSAASRARFFAPRFGFGSPGFLPEKCTVSPACTLNMRAVVTGAVTAAASALPAATASALPAAAASVLPAAASLRAALAALRAALASLRALAALSSLLPVSEPASSCSSAKIRASSSLPICVLVAGQTGCARLPVAPGFLVDARLENFARRARFLSFSFSLFFFFLSFSNGRARTLSRDSRPPKTRGCASGRRRSASPNRRCTTTGCAWAEIYAV